MRRLSRSGLVGGTPAILDQLGYGQRSTAWRATGSPTTTSRVRRLVDRHHAFGAVVAAHAEPPPPAAPAGAAPDRAAARRARRHAVEVVRRVQEPGHAVLDDFRQPADVRRHDRHLARHRLERRQAEALLRRRQQEHVRRRQQRNDQLLRAQRTASDRPRPARAPSRCAVLSSGPSPTSSRRAGTCAAIRANTCITASIRFTGRKLDTWITSFVVRRCREAPCADRASARGGRARSR